MAPKGHFFLFIGGYLDMNPLLEQIESLVNPLFEGQKFELVDLTYQKVQGGWVLCIYLDKPGGINLDECQVWSEKIGNLLDQSDMIPHAYSLEVSSPGLKRPLKKLKDYERFTGERIFVKLFGPLNGEKNFQGILVGADNEKVQIKLNEGGQVIDLPRQQIAKSNLDPLIEI